jgi:cytochrome bd-type quinol oxidase subunit 2
MSRSAPDRQLIEALSGLDAQANFALVQRTRHSVMAAAHQMRAAQTRHRRQMGIALLAFLGLALLLTPAVWMVADDLFNNGEHFQDAPAMTMSLVATLFSAIFAALIVHLRSRRARDEEES